MIPSRGATIAVGVILALAAWTGAARADCENSRAIDTCLVGTWKQTGGGAAEWMRQNLKMAQVSVQANNNTMIFNNDGTFATGKIDTSAQVAAKEGAPMGATAHMAVEGSGQWSAGDGRLNLCMNAVASSGSIQMQHDDPICLCRR
jgi:hypothetical protein